MAEEFEALDVVAGQAFWLETVKKVAAQVAVARSRFEHVVEADQHRVAHSNHSAFPPATPVQACGSVGASQAAPLADIRNHEQVQTGEELQGERSHRHEA
jgi:hypothetical protein